MCMWRPESDVAQGLLDADDSRRVFRDSDSHCVSPFAEVLPVPQAEVAARGGQRGARSVHGRPLLAHLQEGVPPAAERFPRLLRDAVSVPHRAGRSVRSVWT